MEKKRPKNGLPHFSISPGLMPFILERKIHLRMNHSKLFPGAKYGKLERNFNEETFLTELRKYWLVIQISFNQQYHTQQPLEHILGRAICFLKRVLPAIRKAHPQIYLDVSNHYFQIGHLLQRH